jgi:hypothetical protein
VKWYGNLIISIVAVIAVLGVTLLGFGIANQVRAANAIHPSLIFNYSIQWNPNGGPLDLNNQPMGTREITINGLARNARARTDLTTLEIPAEIDRMPVVAIGFGAFSNNPGSAGSDVLDLERIFHVTISSNVRTIGTDAFRGMQNLTTVTLLEGLQGIGDFAFWNCQRLTNITIPSTVTRIGREAFAFCPRLGDNYLGSNYHGTAMRGFVIPATVRTIGERAFFSSFTYHAEQARIFTEVTHVQTITPQGLGGYSWNAGLGTGWHPGWNQTQIPPMTNPVNVLYPIGWGVRTATFINSANGQVARRVVLNEGIAPPEPPALPPRPTPALTGEGVLRLPTLEGLGFVYDHAGYILHGWETSVAAAQLVVEKKKEIEFPMWEDEDGRMVMNPTVIRDINTSMTFFVVLENKNDLARRAQLQELVDVVQAFVNRHIAIGIHPDEHWNNLWTNESWQYLINTLNEAHEILDTNDHLLGGTEGEINYVINSAYRDLFYARLWLSPKACGCCAEGDCDKQVQHDLPTQIELLGLLLSHANAMWEERNHFNVDRWTWVAFEVALDDAQEIWALVEAELEGAEPWELNNREWLMATFTDAGLNIEEVEGVFFALVEALQAIAVQRNIGVDFLIWLGAIVIILSLIGVAVLVDMSRGRGAVVKIEQPWTTFG